MMRDWNSWRVLAAIPIASILAAALLVLGLNFVVAPLLAMGTQETRPSTPTRGQPTPQMPSRAEVLHTEAPDFQAELIGVQPGEETGFQLSNQRGKVVVMEFWASWCGACATSIPRLNQLRSEYADRGLVLVGVNLDSGFSVDQVQEAQGRFGAEFPSAQDPTRTLQTHYGVTALPTLVVIDREGRVAAVQRGVPPSDGLSRLIEPLLASR